MHIRTVKIFSTYLLLQDCPATGGKNEPYFTPMTKKLYFFLIWLTANMIMKTNGPNRIIFGDDYGAIAKRDNTTVFQRF